MWAGGGVLVGSIPTERLFFAAADSVIACTNERRRWVGGPCLAGALSRAWQRDRGGDRRQRGPPLAHGPGSVALDPQQPT